MRDAWRGTVFSVNPIDQARLLATGFHRLLERLAPTEIPVILLAFPKFATDPDYLFRKLRPVLPADISLTRARAAHAATFNLDKVRVGAELTNDIGAPCADNGVAAPNLMALENAALKREIERLRDAIEAQRRRLEAEAASRSSPLSLKRLRGLLRRTR